jgi:2-amino-4-hydroxy-6-hydroxymethyldihydropteridine diphosphokinase
MIVIALGANLPSRVGAPRATLQAALAQLSAHGVHVVRVSFCYTTMAWPERSDPPFVNAVAQVETRLSPPELMALLQRTEISFGRAPAAKNAPRTLDLDLLDYEGRIETGPPELPHPRLASRAFVLVPLADIAPDWRHPVTGKTVDELIAALPPDAREIERLTD